jgi:hypothetical protein
VARAWCLAEIDAQARTKAGLARMRGIPEDTFRAYLSGRRTSPADFWLWLARQLYAPASLVRQWEAAESETAVA